MTPAPPQSPDLVRSLCRWFEGARRDLPWRRTRDPYAIWISEAMLQQTRVEAVVEAYERFLSRLPTVAALAAATEDEVVALWSGLGYYRRARNLRLAAQAIVRDHGGRFPESREALLALPGVGRYTAGALLSIAFDQQEPLVDGNVARVFARLFELDEPPGSARDRALWARAAALVPPTPQDPDAPDAVVSPRNFNQALMELGALVCLPRGARCGACPLASHCQALASGRVEELPVRAQPREPVDVRLEVLLAVRGSRVLLARRPAAGRMAGLLELPTRELSDREPVLWPSDFPARVEPGDELGTLAHAITHHRIRAVVRLGAAPARVAAPLRWVELAEAQGLALTGMARKALARFGGRTRDHGTERDRAEALRG